MIIGLLALAAICVLYYWLDNINDPLRMVAIVTVLLCGQGVASAADAFPHFSAIRAYTNLPRLQQDMRLQVEAQRRVDNLAVRGWSKSSRRNHPPGRRAGDREGVGVWSRHDPLGKRFFSCNMNSTRYKFAGAATAIRGGSTYYCLILGN